MSSCLPARAFWHYRLDWSALTGLEASQQVTVRLCAPSPLSHSGVDFERQWRGLKSDRAAQAAYLLSLPPTQLPALLRQALTPGLLAAAAAALLRPAMQQAPGAAVALLQGLAGAPRFDLNLLSLPAATKASLRADWDAAAARLAGEAAERLAALRRTYQL